MDDQGVVGDLWPICLCCFEVKRISDHDCLRGTKCRSA